jgi:hypothetical protein
MTLLVTPADIVAETVVSIGTEPHKLAKAIPLAQARHLRPLLGLALFDELLALADTAPDYPGSRDAAAVQEYNAARAAWLLSIEADPLGQLLAQVKPQVCAWAVIEAWPSLLGHVTAAGIVTKVGKSEGTTSADERLAAQMFDGLRETAVFESEELARWLKKNADKFTAYCSPRPRQTGRLAIGGIYLP